MILKARECCARSWKEDEKPTLKMRGGEGWWWCIISSRGPVSKNPGGLLGLSAPLGFHPDIVTFFIWQVGLWALTRRMHTGHAVVLIRTFPTQQRLGCTSSQTLHPVRREPTGPRMFTTGLLPLWEEARGRSPLAPPHLTSRHWPLHVPPHPLGWPVCTDWTFPALLLWHHIVCENLTVEAHFVS